MQPKNKILSEGLIIILLAIVSIASYYTSGLFTHGFFLWSDMAFPLVPHQGLEQTSYAWNHFSGSGLPYYSTNISPYFLIIYALNHMGIPLWVINKSIFILPVFLRGLATYFLLLIIISGELRFKRISALISAIFFMAVPLDIWANPPQNMALASIPLVLVLFIKGAKARNQTLYIVLISFAWILASIHAIGVFFSAVLLLSFSIFNFLFLDSLQQRLRYLFFVGKVALILCLISSFYLIPLIIGHTSGIFHEFSYTNLPKGWYESQLRLSAPLTYFIYVMRLVLGKQASIAYYSTGFLIIAGFLVVIYAYLSIYTRNKMAFYFSLVSLLATIAATGIAHLGPLYLLLVHSPLGAFLHSPYYFLYLIAFSYACMVGITFNYLLSNITVKKFFGKDCLLRIGSILLIVSAIALIVFPVFYGPGFRGTNVRIPKEYYDARELLLREGRVGDRFLEIPPGGYVTYSWSPNMHMCQIASFLSPLPNFYALVFTGNNILNPALRSLENRQFEEFYSLLNCQKIRYILIHKDIINRDTFINKQMLDYACYKKLITCIMNNKYFILYELNSNWRNRRFLPYIYPTISPTFVSGDIEALGPMSYTKYLDGKPILLFREQMQDSGVEEFKGLMGEGQNFVFKDSNWQNLAVQLAGFPVSLLAGEKSEVEIKEAGIYEIYVDISEAKEEIPEFKINIDGSWWGLYTGGQILDTGRKFIKVRDVELEEGKHIINCIWVSDYPEIMEKGLKLVLVNKKEKQDLEKVIWQKVNQPQTGLCYIFEEEKREFYVP